MEAAAGTTVSRPAGSTLAKPKRPLSAFNLFYRFKRQHVLDAVSAGDATKESIAALVATSPGLEHTPPGETASLSPDEANELRRATIRKDLEGHILPRDTRDRQHRTNASGFNGAMSFLELGQLMNASWKGCDDFSKNVFRELSDEGREVYRQRMAEYNRQEKEARRRVGGMAAAKMPEEEPEEKEKRAETKAKKDKRKDKLKNKKRKSSEKTSQAMALGQEIFIPSNPGAPSSGLLPPGTLQAPRGSSEGLAAESEPDSAALRARVRDLEGQLETERLRLRVNELESALVRQRAVEEGLRGQLLVLLRSHAGAQQAAVPQVAPVNVPAVAPPPANAAQGGLQSLMSAAMSRSGECDGEKGEPSKKQRHS